MAEKKLTPIQEAIESLKTMREDANLPAFKSGISKCIEKLSLLPPKEKEFAKDMFDAAREYNGPYPDDLKYHSFNEYYKQYEP